MQILVRILVTGLSVAALTAATQNTTIAVAAPAASNADTAILAAMRRDLGMTAAEVSLLRQDKAITVDSELRGSLGAAFAGSWFHPAAGMLVVNVTDPAAAAKVSKAGARARVVEHSHAELDAIQAELDTAAGDKAKASATVGLASWRIDPKTDSVVVTALTGQRPAVLGSLARHGDAVTVEYVDGHFFGTTAESWFPHWDHALIRAENTGHWEQGPFVLSPSGYIDVGQPEDLPVNSYVCKSGITTGWTCGFVTAKNVTVQYAGQSEPVYYLTQSNVCSEPGDSGGSTVAATTVWLAEGMTSGGQLVEVDGRKRCLSAIGQPNGSYYYPAAKALEWYGPELGLQLM